MGTITIITSITINCGKQEGFLRPVAMLHRRIQLVMLQGVLFVIRPKTLDLRMVGKHQCSSARRQACPSLLVAGIRGE